MKKTLFAAATIATFLLCACSKQENEAETSGKTGMTFYGTIEQADTKTVLADNLKVNWQNGDRIMVKGTERDAQDFIAVPDSENPTKATFTNVVAPMPELVTPPYQAYFPADIWNSRYRLPSLPTIQYHTGCFDAPMYAESDDDTFHFYNLCGVLHFALKAKYSSVTRIEVEAVDEIVIGNFSVSNGKDINMAYASYSNKATLACISDVQLNSETATNFYVYLPPQTYKAGMTITITNSQGDKYVRTTTKDFVVERSNIYTFNWDVTPKTGAAKASISGKDVDVPWIELWEGGPKFAAYNVGVTDGKESSYGGYYDQKSAYAFNDRATETWGTNWKTPSKSDLQGLLSNCTASEDTVDGICGTRFTGKGVYSVNSIFLPYSGYYSYYGSGGLTDEGVVGCYASCTPITNYSSQQYAQLYISSGRKVIESTGMGYQDHKNIRPVCVNPNL